MNRLLPVHRLLDPKTHVTYTKYVKEGKIPKKHKAKGREEMRLILSTICGHISDGMIEASGGVDIKSLGYFFNWKCPRKMTYHLSKKGEKLSELFNHHTDHYMYFPTFIPRSSKLDDSSTWTFDKTFERKIGERLNKKLRMGFKYHNYLHTLKL